MKPASAEDIRTEAVELMQSLVGLMDEKWLTARRITEIADRHQTHPLEARIELLTGIKTLYRAVPVQIFPDLEAREQLLAAIQEALDAAIDAEDEQTGP